MCRMVPKMCGMVPTVIFKTNPVSQTVLNNRPTNGQKCDDNRQKKKPTHQPRVFRAHQIFQSIDGLGSLASLEFVNKWSVGVKLGSIWSVDVELRSSWSVGVELRSSWAVWTDFTYSWWACVQLMSSLSTDYVQFVYKWCTVCWEKSWCTADLQLVYRLCTICVQLVKKTAGVQQIYSLCTDYVQSSVAVAASGPRLLTQGLELSGKFTTDLINLNFSRAHSLMSGL